jgi:RNA polymerase sigma factor (sigma-70 family)
MSHFLEIQVSSEVLERARSGDRAAGEFLYAALSKPVYTLIRRLVVSPATAEDLLQDVFVELLRNMSLYRGEGSFAGWVRSIAVSKALMHLRSPWSRRLPASDAHAVLIQHVEATAAKEWHEDLERALNALTPVARSIVWLHDVEGYTHGEIARLFGRTVSFSKSQLARAHEQLRQLLEPQSGALTCTSLSRT